MGEPDVVELFSDDEVRVELDECERQEIELTTISKQLRTIRQQIAKLQKEESYLLKKQENMENKLNELKKLKKTQQFIGSTTNKYEWTNRAVQLLTKKFKLSNWRENQKEIINCTMCGNDCFVVMPTGGGKSLCYQLSALLGTGFSLVVTPLISLMQDQCIQLEALNIKAAMINASVPRTEVTKIFRDMKQPPDEEEMEDSGTNRLKLVYVSPEKLAKSKMLLSTLETCYRLGSLDRIVIDEAHCCSEWGHDFRPDYKKLAICKVLFPNTPIIALTATASLLLQKDVEDILKIPTALTFRSSVNRPNLFYRVLSKPAKDSEINEQIIDYLEKLKVQFNTQTLVGIIYCFSCKDADDLASYLHDKGYKALPYHASIDQAKRDEILTFWREEKAHIIVGTIAFGLGINKENVRFVLHHTLPKTVESYYQESGRAGRDGKYADCCVLYRPSDVVRVASMTYQSSNFEQLIVKLFQMIEFVHSNDCRKNSILNYFNEDNWKFKQDTCCDNCLHSADRATFNMKTAVNTLLPILKYIYRSDVKVTLVKMVEWWRGVGRKDLPGEFPTAPDQLNKHNYEQIIVSLVASSHLELVPHPTAYKMQIYLKPSKRLVTLTQSEVDQTFDFPVNLLCASEKRKSRRLSVTNDGAEHPSKIPKLSQSGKIHSGNKILSDEPLDPDPPFVSTHRKRKSNLILESEEEDAGGDDFVGFDEAGKSEGNILGDLQEYDLQGDYDDIWNDIETPTKGKGGRGKGKGKAKTSTPKKKYNFKKRKSYKKSTTPKKASPKKKEVASEKTEKQGRITDLFKTEPVVKKETGWIKAKKEPSSRNPFVPVKTIKSEPICLD